MRLVSLLLLLISVPVLSIPSYWFQSRTVHTESCVPLVGQDRIMGALVETGTASMLSIQKNGEATTSYTAGDPPYTITVSFGANWRCLLSASNGSLSFQTSNPATTNFKFPTLPSTIDGCRDVEDITRSIIAVDTSVSTASFLWTPPTIAGRGDVFVQVTAAAGRGARVTQWSITLNEVLSRSQTIDFPKIGQYSFGDSPFQLHATASSSLPIVFFSSNDNILSISGNLATILGAGSVNVTAYQAGDSDFPAASSSQIVVIYPAIQTISFSLPHEIPVTTTSLELSAQASSGLPISYESSNNNVAIVFGSTLSIRDVGTVVITASQVGDDNWSPASSVSQTLIVAPSNQTINFTALPPAVYGQSPLSLVPFITIDSGLMVYLTSSDSSVATISGIMITIVGAGTTTITASQPGSSRYNPAQPVSQVLEVIKGDQSLSFDPLGPYSISEGTIPLTAQASSGLVITYTSSDTDVAEIVNGSSVRLNSPGITTITANQNGNGNWFAAIPVSQNLTVLIGEQTINFPAFPSIAYGASPIQLTATSSSGLPVSYLSSSPDVASISEGSRLIISGAGTSTITAIQGGDDMFQPVQVDQVLTVDKATQSISFPPLPAVPLSDTSVPLSASSSSRLPIMYTSSNPEVATIDGEEILLVSEGMAYITASQIGDNNYFPAESVTQVLSVYSLSQTPQTIDFPSLASRQYGDVPFEIVATASPSNYLVSFTSSNTSVVTINQNIATIVGAGTTTITAFQPGDSVYAPASPVERVLTVSRASQEIISPPIEGHVYGNSPFVLPATATSGLPVSYTTTTPDVVSIEDPNIVHILNAGSATILASQPGDGNWAPTNSTISVTINKASQVIAFTPLPPYVSFTDKEIALQANASSGLVVTFSSSNPSVAIINGDLLVIEHPGVTIITASQEGNNNFFPATGMSQTLEVAKGQQIIVFETIDPSSVHWSPTLPPLRCFATSSSDLPISFSSSNLSVFFPLDENSFAIHAAGVANITASQPGDDRYLPAEEQWQTVTIEKAIQTIFFPPITPRTKSDIDFAAGAWSSFGLPMSYASSNSSVIVVDDTMGVVKIVGIGVAELIASQAGNGSVRAAETTFQLVEITDDGELEYITAEGVRLTLGLTADSLQQSYFSAHMADLQTNLTSAITTNQHLAPGQVVVRSVDKNGEDAVGIVFDILPPAAYQAASAIVSQFASDRSSLKAQFASNGWHPVALEMTEIGSEAVPSSSSSSATTSTGSSSDEGASIVFKGEKIAFLQSTTLTGGFSLYWNINENGTIEIAVRARPSSSGGWVGFGFGARANQMVGSHAVIGYAQSGESGIGDYYLGAQDPSAVTVTDQQKLIQQDVDFDSNTGAVTLLFTRPLDVPGVSTIVPNTNTLIVWAVGHYPSNAPTLDYHTSAYDGVINFASGEAKSSDTTPEEKAHAVLMSLGWGFFIPIGIMVARFMKPVHRTAWFHAHRALQIFGTILGTAGFIIGIAVIGSGHFTTHRGMGIAVAVLGWFQIVNALIRPTKQENQPISTRRWIWWFVHSGLGRAAVVIAFVNIFYGLQIISVDYKYTIVFIVWTVVLGCCFLALQIHQWFGTRGKKDIAPVPPPLPDVYDTEMVDTGMTASTNGSGHPSAVKVEEEESNPMLGGKKRTDVRSSISVIEQSAI